MKIFLLGLVTGMTSGGGVLLLILLSYFAFGFAPVSTAASPMPLEHYLRSQR